MKKFIALSLIFLVLTGTLIFKSIKPTDTIVIYTSTEDYNMALLQQRLDENFPDYDIVIEYMSTSNIATKIIEEDASCECDIVFALEYGYLDMLILNNKLANLSFEYDRNIYADDTITETNKNYILPTIRSGGGVIINKKVLQDKGIKKPTKYEDLLSDEYKGLLSMPSPKSSGTGYMFYLSLVNALGEEKALEYFDGFAKNVVAFTSSGSGPVNALTNREAAVGLGMISQAVDKIKNGNNELEVLFFDEGAPFSLYGTGVVNGKQNKLEVMEVMDYLYSSYIEESCQKFYPEKIFKNKNFEVENFPKSIKYADMKQNTLENKENLLKKWKY